MKFRQTSFWRNYVKLYLQYMAVGVAAIPAGVLYAFVASRGYESRWSALFAIVIGCWCARQAWKFVDRKFKVREQEYFTLVYAFTASNANLNTILETQAGEAVLTWEKSILDKEFKTESSKAALNSLPIIAPIY